ncbi:uncharacterized protein EI90DRAFT_3132673 [Cantharellus anzutake]|uniref:uncharacterized protein n=1 Tax=Cantharellus anzutake TaxID=1750568 RepID=UPI0019045A5B|nr:uncharacterized protein EI90DRAFT_3132673 [Cantharellus anzutake]KAF8319243.1 hypothetical protein EI90DRAFT_3132673 [Cantharellus anzutake]
MFNKLCDEHGGEGLEDWKDHCKKMAAQFNMEKQEAIKDMALVDNNQAVAMKRLEGELRGTIDLTRHADILCFMFKGCFSPPLDLIPWKTLPLMLIKQKGGDYAKVKQWCILYDAVGGEAPAERYAEYGKNHSLKLVDVIPWSAEDGARIPNSKDYKDIVLLQDNQGAGGHQGHVLLTIRDVSGLLSTNEAPGLADIQLTTSTMAVQSPCSLLATLSVSLLDRADLDDSRMESET